MKKPRGSLLLIMVLLGVVIVAIIMFAKSGVYDKLVGSPGVASSTPIDSAKELQNQVDEYNKNLNNQIKN